MAHKLRMKAFTTLIISTAILSACGNSDSSKTSATAAKASQQTPAQRGAKVFAKCRACHTLDENGRNKVGPNLWGLYGSETASKDGYAYSKAMRSANIIWDETSLDAYLKRPADFMPGNKMSFIGLKKQEDRDAVQAYLKEKTSP